MAPVKISNALKRYGTVEVLKGVSIDIDEGEFVVLVGPSGCGKSTLLRMVAGLEGISGGTISIGDRVVNDLPPKQRDIAMVFQSYALYPHMTVAENMAFSLRMKRVDKKTADAKVEQAAQMLGLGSLLGRYPRELSGGQRQRVAMGRAVVRNPAVFLFDEPLSNLDAKLRVQMRAEIKDLHQRVKTTTIYVTHDQVEAMTMADTIVVMRDGKIEQMGTPIELFDNPSNIFVAQFIGSPSMNIIEGTLGPKGFVTSDGHVLPAPQSRAVAKSYGIRPEHLVPDPAGIPMEVVIVEPMGSETQLILRLGQSTLTSLVRHRLDVVPGTVMGFSADLSSVHLFDQNGNRCVD
ncbi:MULTISPECIES: ABC transporter ATP-binding protein [Devosia]|uniref:ABC transporter ATP-binding protein n=1 Tax=Devosia TaxID=46913 RepID=UPI000CE94092|nr:MULTISPECIES: sn-glycerol-3-phosphate ABC transporter ATP-binding protein UgpC [Devosia]AVF02978.1 sugar ABC transporter ATP-binding protein [Devosia sp. I507]